MHGCAVDFFKKLLDTQDQTDKLYREAHVFAPQDAATLGNYASFLLSVNSVTEGHAMLDLAIAALQSDFAAASLLAEVWRYAVCNWLPERWTNALVSHKRFLLPIK